MQPKLTQLTKYCLLLLISSVLFSCDEEQKLQKLSKNGVILAFGDSLTSGAGANPEQSYPAILEELTGHKVINAGISGEVSTEGLKRLPRVLKQYQPELVILCHGGNDILRKKDLKKTKNNIKEMITLAKNNGSAVILLGVPKPGIFLHAADFYEKIATEMDVVYAENIIADTLSDADLKSDTVHPNHAGYKHIAEQIYALLQETEVL